MSESLRLALDPSRHEETAPIWEESTLVGESCSGGGMCAPGGRWCVSSMRGRPASCEVDARHPSTDAEIDALKASRQRSVKRAAFCNAAARRQALAGGGDKKESLEREQWQVRCAMGLSSAAAQGERGREGDEGGRLSPAAKCGGEAVAAEERLLLVREGDAPRLIRALHEHVRRLYASAVSISLRGRGSAGDGFRSLRLGTRPAGGPRDLECVIDDLRRQHSIKLHEPSAADEPRPLARPAASRAPFFVSGAVGQWKARRGAPPATTTSICPPPVPRRAGDAASAPHEGRRRAPSLHSVLLRAAASHIRPADPSDEPAAAAGPPPLQQAQGSPQRSHASPRRQPRGLMGRTARCKGVVKASAGAPRGARVRFSLQEDRAIREGFAHFQGVSCAIWEDILKRGRAVFHSKRTAVSLKDRARTLKLK
ncbi:hypothetical protein AB1Y20_016844 [Prymnesium parvum]|uniref:Myb-like domain-containing protein n=1 Tax=Prymnesium parvum TaxID=97485 RepID=A0AB34IC59_PRYPA